MSRVAGLVAGQAAPDALDLLEAEAIHVLREAAGQFDRPALLFSGGKDSAVLLHVATRAFAGAPLPFPLLHIDTGHNFAEVIQFRDRRVAQTGTELVVGAVADTIAAGRVADVAAGQSRNALQSRTLLDAISAHKFDALIGGARRDEEKARAKERIFSLRDAFGGWDPHRQRPELWRLYNGAHQPGENVRVFPLSNWTELDIWRYIGRQNIELPALYYAHERDVVKKDGMLLAITEWSSAPDRAAATRRQVRYRTVGDAISTGAVESAATDPAGVLAEVTLAEHSERGATRADDRTSDAAMEDRKREGYF
jgi:sulfate adenylyltransferase subunit 2